MRPDRAERGHTLLELLLVVMILAIMAGVAGVVVGASGSQQLDLAEVQVRDAVAWAQSQARSNRVVAGVVFDLGQDSLALVDGTGALLDDPLTHSGYVVRFHRVNQPALVDIAAADFGAAGRVLIFDAQGVPLTGGLIRLEANALTRVLTVNAATGAVVSSL